MSIKDELVKKTAEELGIPENTVDKIISWSFKKVNEATGIYNEIEISGIGKFMISNAKLTRRITKYEEIIQNSLDNQRIVEDTTLKLQALKPRKDALELQRNNSRVEKHDNPS